MPKATAPVRVPVPDLALRLSLDSCCARYSRAAAPVALGQAAGGVHQRRSGPHQSGTRQTLARSNFPAQGQPASEFFPHTLWGMQQIALLFPTLTKAKER